MIVVEASEPPGEGAVNCGIVVGLLMLILTVVEVVLFIFVEKSKICEWIWRWG